MHYRDEVRPGCRHEAGSVTKPIGIQRSVDYNSIFRDDFDRLAIGFSHKFEQCVKLIIKDNGLVKRKWHKEWKQTLPGKSKVKE